MTLFYIDRIYKDPISTHGCPGSSNSLLEDTVQTYEEILAGRMKETVLGGISSPPAYPGRQLLVPTVVSAPGQGWAPEDALEEKVMTEERREAVPLLWTEWMTVSALRCFERRGWAASGLRRD